MSATTSSTDVGTPVHVSSASFVNEGGNSNYLTSEDQLDLDEAIDLDDHVTGQVDDHVTNQVDDHVTQRMKPSASDDSNEEASTAEEGRDSAPNYESTTTTDNFIDTLEPIDYIESNPRLHPSTELRYHANGSVIGRHGNETVPPPPGHRYENWSVMLQLDEGTKKSRVLKRNKGSRVTKVDRQRTPYPLPRPAKIKQVHPRPSPLSRKRRYSGRCVRALQPPNASEETDMAQADEMGEGEGRDDGFIDGGQEPFKRRSKKRAGGVHTLLPSLGHGSPQSSPSNTPVSRRKISTRKSRLKPRTRRHSKPQLASADISTQESTTQGPGSSDTSEAQASLDEASQLRQGEDDIVQSDSDGDYEDARSITPNPRDVGVVNNVQPIKLRNGVSPLSESKSFLHRDQVSDIQPPPVTVMHMSGKDSLSDDNLQRDSNETSDTDLTPLPRSHHHHWMNKRLESDLSTAPFSSETSDMETSGNERVLTTDGGSATDLNPLRSKAQGSPPTPASSPSPMGKVPTQHIPSGSSGDEVKKSRLSVKSKQLPAKPAPPPKKLSSSSVEPPPLAVRPVGMVKKPLHATKSSPSPNKVGMARGGAQLRNQQSEGGVSPSRGKSIKVSIPAKPKPPPVPAKPAGKPEVKPKPIRVVQSVGSMSSGGGGSGAARTKAEGEQEAREGSQGMRKVASETELGVAKGFIRRSPTLGPRKLTQVREEMERKRQSTPPRPLPPHIPAKPAVPSKPKRQPSEKKPIHVPAPPISPVKPDTTNKFTSDSSKTPSSSETTTSGPSQSPTLSPHTSPNLGKRFVKGTRPAILPKKPSVKGHQRALSDSTRVLRKIETTDSSSPLTVVNVSTTELRLRERGGASKGGESVNNEPKKSMRIISPVTKAPPTDGTTSPPPPPIPPRSRKSSHLELVIPVGETGSSKACSSPEPAYRKKLSAPRRPPPSPPSPVPKLLATEAQPTSNEPTDSDSRLSHYDRRPNSAVMSDHYAMGVAPWDPDTPPQPYMYASVNKLLKTSPEKQRSKTPDFLSRDHTSLRVAETDVRKNSDSELEMTSKKRSKVVRRESSRRAPPKPPKYDTPDETTGYVKVNTETMLANQQKLGSRSPGSRNSASPLRDGDSPPPLPTQPIPKRKAALKKSASTIIERSKLRRDPIYDVIPDIPKKKQQAKHREYEEIDLIDADPPPELMGGVAAAMEPPVEVVKNVHEALPHKQTKKPPQGNYAQLPIEDLRENWKTSPHSKRRPAKSFSGKKSQSLMYRRFNSERFTQRRILTLDPAITRKSMLHRTPSLDRLDDRMGRSLRRSIHYCQDSSSSDDDDVSGIVSPISAALPKVPSEKALYSSPKLQKSKLGKQSSGSTSYFVPPDVEPLYQYINTAEFLRETSDSSPKLAPPPGVGQPKQNQLEIARQLSQRRLWCEQPEVIQSGVLKSLSEEERKLQEAMFEVISSEATYLRSVDVLIDHFMDDPGMNPNLPEGRRVLDKRQHHVIFSNVREVREVSARFLSDLETRQKESAVVKNISDIVLDYAENHFECYVRYCTNQIYQSRELQDCLENNLMFREYLRRLESHKICQNLNMQSFLLLPMQRITRLPLLILAILNRTPLDYPDQGLVETTLRKVQKLVTACNDGARKMERTEQLHEIYKKLYFGKLKPFPLVSASRQLERKGTLVQLQVDQKLFGKRKITKKPLYVFVFTDYIIITKKKKDTKGDYLYKVVDHASRAMLDVENVETISGMTFPKPVLGDQDPITEAMWAVSVAGTKHAFLLVLLDNVYHQTARYLFLASNDTDKTRWLDSLSRQDVEKENEKIYQTWDCPQVQAVFDYKAKQPDELDLQRGDVVKVYRKMADGWYEGERLRDLQCGWFPSNFTMEVQNEHTRARNLRETHRLNSLLAANDMILSSVQIPRYS